MSTLMSTCLDDNVNGRLGPMAALAFIGLLGLLATALVWWRCKSKASTTVSVTLTLEDQLAASKTELREVQQRYADELREVQEVQHRVEELQRRLLHQHRQQGSAAQGLAGMAKVQDAFHFLDGPVNILCAATTCRRWHELACANSVWRALAGREGILDKAIAFEVEVPLVQEGTFAIMLFYARVFALKV